MWVFQFRQRAWWAWRYSFLLNLASARKKATKGVNDESDKQL